MKDQQYDSNWVEEVRITNIDIGEEKIMRLTSQERGATGVIWEMFLHGRFDTLMCQKIQWKISFMN